VTRLVVAVCLAVVAAAITFHQVRRRKQRLATLSSGLLCFHCDSSEVERVGDGGLDCRTCGQHTSKALLDANVDPRDLEAMSTPEDRRL